MLTTYQSFATYRGNGVTTQFPYGFIIQSASQLVVTITNNNVSPPATTVLAPSQYSVTGIGSGAEFSGGSGPGGNVSYPVSGNPLPAGYTITIQRVVPYLQPTSLTNQGAFYPQVVEAALDLLTMMCQQLSAQTAGSVPIWAIGPQGQQGNEGPAGASITGPAGAQGPPGSSNVSFTFSGLQIQNDASLPTTKVDISFTSMVLAPVYTSY
jgi:hypothetical protein